MLVISRQRLTWCVGNWTPPEVSDSAAAHAALVYVMRRELLGAHTSAAADSQRYRSDQAAVVYCCKKACGHLSDLDTTMKVVRKQACGPERLERHSAPFWCSPVCGAKVGRHLPAWQLQYSTSALEYCRDYQHGHRPSKHILHANTGSGEDHG